MTDQLQPWLPDLVVAGGIALLLVLPRVPSLAVRAADVVLLVVACSAAAAVVSMTALPFVAAGGLVADPWSAFLRFVLATVAMAVAWLATRAHEEAGDARSWILFLLALLGAYVVVSAAHAATALAGLEVAWIGTALWIGSRAPTTASRGAAAAMLLEGAVARGLVLLGVAMLFGLGGELGWSALGGRLAATTDAPGAHAAMSTGVALVFAGLFARAALVPWHGTRAGLIARTPLPASVWLQVGLPVAAVALLARFVRTTLVVSTDDGRWQSLPGVEWTTLVALFATATVAVGHVAALRERDVRRLFGWLATAQVGYLAIGLVAADDAGLGALLFHAVVVAGMTAGSMVAVAPVVEAAASQDFEVLRGLARRGGSEALLAGCLVVFLLSFAAVLPTAGYEGRARLLAAVIASGGAATTLVLSAASLVGLVACTRVLVTLFDRPSGEAPRVPADFEAALLAVLLAAATLAVGFAPGPLASLAGRSAVMHVAVTHAAGEAR